MLRPVLCGIAAAALVVGLRHLPAAEDNPLNYSYWPPLPKGDREPLRQDSGRMIPTEPIPDVPTALPPVRVDPPPPPRPVLAAKPDDGLCARYGMRKVFTEGGRSWRCRH